MAGRLPFPYPSVFDANGNPLSGAKLNFYQSGTSTPLNTFSDAALTIPNANPVVADSAGRFSDIFLGDGPYKVVLSTSASVVQWTADPVYSPNAVGPQNYTLPVVGGTANAVTLTYAQPPVALTAGLRVSYRPTAPNTGATTVNLNSLGAKNVFRQSGASLVALTSGETQTGGVVDLEYDGTQWQLIDQMPGLYLIQTQTAAGVATIDFTAGLDGTFNEYLFVLTSVIPATNTVLLELRVSVDAGATWKAGATDYYRVINILNSAGTNTVSAAPGETAMVLANNLSNNSGRPLNGEVRCFGPSSALLPPFTWALAASDTVPSVSLYTGAGYFNLGNAFNGVRFFMSSGNISGTISLYGVRK